MKHRLQLGSQVSLLYTTTSWDTNGHQLVSHEGIYQGHLFRQLPSLNTESVISIEYLPSFSRSRLTSLVIYLIKIKRIFFITSSSMFPSFGPMEWFQLNEILSETVKFAIGCQRQNSKIDQGFGREAAEIWNRIFEGACKQSGHKSRLACAASSLLGLYQHFCCDYLITNKALNNNNNNNCL